ncbi:DUF6440 family protein [Enterococcus faecalis]|uniref:DUF6440 family protein n=1 Tax=Enterococcus faecalis TaxID=1351 RepID=UPI003CC54C63
MPVNKNGLPFYFDRKLDVIRFGVDTVTGVNYLESPRGGITPLLDETEKVCIDKISK